jgi:predicted nucleic acid-binding protein
MSSHVFVDTGAWLALADKSDNLHAVAKETYPTVLKSGRHLVTTNLVVAETYNLLRRRLGFDASMGFLTSLRQSARAHVVFSDAVLEREAERILLHYRDQDFSYVDAVSFAYMNQQPITEAFAFDHHFLVAGFFILP